MNLRLLFSTIIAALILILSMGNKNGRASSQNRGNTGAPGDETTSGQPKTCMNCHNQGPITASVAISVLDSNNQVITQYIPGNQYTASVKITASGTGLQGYGFQMIALRDAGNTDLDGFKDTNSNNYKIANISNGKTYAEHDNISSSNTFNVKWVAPMAGTGNVTFYASGNGVNGNGTTSGDGAGVHSLKLFESGTVAINEPNDAAFQIKISPNPILEDALLDTGKLPTGKYQIRAFNATSKLVWENQVVLSEAGTGIKLPSTEWLAGIYFIHLNGAGKQAIVKVLKL